MSNNPFDFDGAKNLPDRLLIDWFIDDHNYSRFLKSSRNVLLLGHRGCGKSMTLLYYSLPLELKKLDTPLEQKNLSHIGVYVSCSTPLARRVDHDFFEDEKFSKAISEHYFVLSIAVAIAEHCEQIVELFDTASIEELRDELFYVFDDDLPGDSSLFKCIKRALKKELRNTQEQFLSFENRTDFTFARTFYTLIVPFLGALRSTSVLSATHFSLMIDDAQDLNDDQRLMLNSWLSYRDHSVFSFKVALATVVDFDRRTSTGGSIIEGHDYIAINLEQPFQNESSQFGMLARSIIEKRLKNIGIESSPDKFFEESLEFKAELDICWNEVIGKYTAEHPEADKKKINDYAYKQARALYFRKRSPKANRPIYAGLDTLIHLSSGVVRNLLLPCYWMYDDALSKSSGKPIQSISPSIQAEVIMRESEKLWSRVRDGLDRELDDCSKEQAQQVFNLVSALGDYFRDRLFNHASEPRIITFTISERTPECDKRLLPILGLMRKAQVMYRRSGPSKDGGRQEDYYTLNRLFWPARGLDPHGQHGRASIKSSALVASMLTGKFPSLAELDMQRGLFDE
ncbi:ORC-CDC6 family AAA ATPase [Pseudomonas viridiflava]